MAASRQAADPRWLRAARWYQGYLAGRVGLSFAGDIAYLVRQIAGCEASALRLSVFLGGQSTTERVAPHARV